MEYIRRELERKFIKASNNFKAVMVTGARQVGKSTMLRELAKNTRRKYVSLDSSRDRELARTDPDLFFQMYQPPVLIDEIQKAPQLFEKIKIFCDESDQNGLFWLTGSESRKLIKYSQDSLAGRLAILHLYSLSQREKMGLTDEGLIDLSIDALMTRQRNFPENNIIDVFEHIWQGGMPGAYHLDSEARDIFYDSYIDTYIMRDAVVDNGISDVDGFRRMLRACAAFAGNLINYSDLASAAQVSVPTVKSWVKILQMMGILYLLEPYSNNELKRLIKTPKLYFLDTGLCAYLSMWTSRDVLMQGAASGHFFENYVVGEFVRALDYSPAHANMMYYRDTNQHEIDLIIESDGELHPIEIKKAASPDKRAVKAFSILEKASQRTGRGGIVCMAQSPFPIDSMNSLIPCNLI